MAYALGWMPVFTGMTEKAEGDGSGEYIVN
jgi:hypothetical protein